MNVLESYLLLQVAMLIGQTTMPAPSATQILLDAAQPVVVVAPIPRVDGVPNDALSALKDFPTKIWVQDNLRDLVARMWVSSPTFRRQGLQIQSAGAVQVQIRIDPGLVGNPQHLAMCELRHYQEGAMIARISVPPLRTVELIGHEMEHVCERLEGIKVERLARNRQPGYYSYGVSDLRFESDRAIRVGRQVLSETSVAEVLTLTRTR